MISLNVLFYYILFMYIFRSFNGFGLFTTHAYYYWFDFNVLMFLNYITIKFIIFILNIRNITILQLIVFTMILNALFIFHIEMFNIMYIYSI